MGTCHAVGVKEYGSKKVTVFEQTGDEEGLVASIILRSSVNRGIGINDYHSFASLFVFSLVPTYCCDVFNFVSLVLTLLVS